jgi:CRISPR system Cascade subunit CasA
MSPPFNLIDEPFIPVRGPDGAVAELGIRDTLLRAHQLREVRDGSPLVTASLLRLLLAVLHRVLGPEDPETWGSLWQAGRWDPAVVAAYLDTWRGRFDLFDERYPFYQVPGFVAKRPSPVSRLAHELSSGHNATLFDHTRGDDFAPCPPARAARLVVAQQAFAVCGGKSDTGYTAHAPLLQGLIVLPQGRTLFETLALNLVQYNAEAPFPGKGDLPAWEADQPAVDGLGRPRGYLDYLTWQSRQLALHPEDCGGQVVVRRVSYAQGRKLDAPGLLDPMMAYTVDKKLGMRPLRLQEDRALWRDSAALFQASGRDTGKRPGCFDWLQRQLGLVGRGRLYDLAVFGLCNDQAKVHFWSQERMPLPVAYLDDVDLVGELSRALRETEAADRALHAGLRRLAGLALAPGGQSPDKDRVRTFVVSLGAGPLYWSALDVPFRHFFVDLAGHAGDLDALQRSVAQWVCETVAPHALRSFDRVTGALDRTARLLRAVAEARAQLQTDLARLQFPHREVLRETTA